MFLIRVRPREDFNQKTVRRHPRHIDEVGAMNRYDSFRRSEALHLVTDMAWLSRRDVNDLHREYVGDASL